MNELEKYVLEIIGEDTDSPDVFTDTDTGMIPIRDSLNDAIQEISALTGSHTRKYYVPLTTGQIFYRLTLNEGSIGWITDVWLINESKRLTQTDFTRLTYINPRWMKDTGPPDEYFQVGKDIIGVYRKPSGTDQVLEVTMVVIPKRYEKDTDRIFLRDSFKWAAVHYAVSEYWASRGDAKEAMYWLDKYLTALGIQRKYPQAQERVYTERTHEVLRTDHENKTIP